MEKRIPRYNRLCRRAIKLWFAFSFHKIRLIFAKALVLEGPTLLAVGHPASFLEALILGTAFKQPVHCLVPRNLVRGRLADFLARGLGMVLTDDGSAGSSAAAQPAANVLLSGGTFVLFADPSPGPQDSRGALARTAASLVARLESQVPGRQVAVRAMHLFLPESSSRSREFLIYVDSPVVSPEGRPAAGRQNNEEAESLVRALEQSIRAHAFQLLPASLDYFCTDLEAVLQASLREDWASRPNWKQDAEGFELSGFVKEWVRETNIVNPARIVALRESLDEYHHLLQQRALRQLEFEAADPLLRSRWRRALLWLESLVGLPIALYGALNHLIIGALVFLLGGFKKTDPGNRTRQWAIRGAIVVAGYAVQTFLVAHRWGRAAAGYYAPTLPLTGAYLLRYLWLLRHRTRLLFLSLSIAFLTSKAKKVRAALFQDLDQAVIGSKAKAGAAPRSVSV